MHYEEALHALTCTQKQNTRNECALHASHVHKVSLHALNIPYTHSHAQNISLHALNMLYIRIAHTRSAYMHYIHALRTLTHKVSLHALTMPYTHSHAHTISLHAQNML